MVDVKLANYQYRFKRLRWREEFAIVFPPNKDPYRVVLANALVEVSGLKIKSLEEAFKVLDAVPSAIVERIFKIYKGSLPASRRFVTAGLYKAPLPSQYIRHQVESEEEVGKQADKVVQQMESKFGKKELDEAREIDRQILTGAKKQDGGYRGAVKKDS